MGKSKDLATLTNGGNIAGNFTVDTDTLHVDSTNDRIGFGTTSPSSFSGYNNISVKGGSNGTNFDFQNSSGTRVASIVSAPSTQLIVETLEDADVRIKTNNVERLIVDGSGRVTMPNQPRASAGSTMGGAGSNRHPASTIYVQIGGTNLASSGRFTCPVAGVYRATLTGYTNYTGSYGYVYLKKNGSQQGYNIHFNNAQGVMHTIVALNQLVNCTANDYLEFWGGAGSGYVHYSTISFELVG